MLREFASRLGIGRLLLHFWHRPIGHFRNLISHGGPKVIRATARARTEMEQAAFRLPPLPTTPLPDSPLFTLHILTGRHHWFQTAFCLKSFVAQATLPFKIELYDDGTFDSELLRQVERLAPRAQVRQQSELLSRLDQFLPQSNFPALRERWHNYPNIRKLIDPHIGSSGWKLVIDSDLLFFHRPDHLLRWLHGPDRPLHGVDCRESYGYSRDYLSRISGTPIPALVNVGLCGLRSETLDWEKLEFWCQKLTVDQRPSYYLEQALVAMLVADHKCAVAPASDYVTCPHPPEALECRAVMHHYVAESKRWYFQNNWRRFLEPSHQ